MDERRFHDAVGNEWRVHIVVHAPRIGPMYPAHSAQFRPSSAWLAFESESERRRLSPVPLGWEGADVDELQRLLQSATVITRRVK
jgi:hypothetical protein